MIKSIMESETNKPKVFVSNTGQHEDGSGFSLLKLLKIQNKYVIGLFILGIISFGSSAYLLSIASQKQATLKRSYAQPPLTIPSIISFLPTAVPQSDLPVSSTPIFTPAPTIDPIASWSAYTSNSSSYSFKYPFDWIVRAKTQTDPKILEYLVVNPNSASASALSITLSYGTRTYQEAVSLRAQNGDAINVASVSGYKTLESDSDQNVSINIVLPVKTNTLVVYAEKQYEDIFNKILSTLKF